jgi:hypothetical protein
LARQSESKSAFAINVSLLASRRRVRPVADGWGNCFRESQRLAKALLCFFSSMADAVHLQNVARRAH